MVYVGLNGFGRIGKSIFLQLLNHKTLKIKAINVTKFDLKNFKKDLENFLKGIELACDKDTTFLFTSPGIDVSSYLIKEKIKIFCKKNLNCFFIIFL